ncbi:MAG: AAC(3) family N-acetyltransferase [Defluviitaleaceae bacterium]|nr:AAC(3) family N-acetyltransferase [Defluviitaleaceae bacterium]
MNEFTTRFISALRALGIAPDDTLLVHSSLKSLGWVDGGAETVIRALIEALPDGTLLMPALDWKYVTKENPRFSVMETPACVGTIPETFRKFPGVLRSVHPTHSVCAYGADAEEMTSRHYLDRTPVGENSPFRMMAEYRGKILMLGCGLRPNTFMHGVEEAARLPYVLEEEPTRFLIEDKDGGAAEAFHYMHNFKGIGQRYDRAAECLDVKGGKVLDADAFVMDAVGLWDAASKKIAEDPWFFVDRK